MSLIGLVTDRIWAVLWEGHEFTSHVALTRRNPSGKPLTWPNPPRLWFANNTSLAFALSADSLTAFASQTLSAAQVDAIIASGDTRISLKDSVTGEPFATGRWSLKTAAGPAGVGLVPGSGQGGYTVVNDVLVISGQAAPGGGGGSGDINSLDDVPDSATRKAMTPAERAKLAGVAAGAEVNVQPDWAASSGDAAILNKPATMPPAAHDHPASTISDLAEAVHDIVGGLIKAGVNTTVSYDDVAGSITINATGGSGGSTDPEIVRDVIGGALVAGSGIQVTVNDAADTLTITSTAVLPTRQVATGDGLTGGGNLAADRTLAVDAAWLAEQVRDTMGSALVAGSPNVTVTPDDALNTITVSVSETGATTPDATTTTKGVVELATTAETTAGTDTARAVTPAGVKAVGDSKVPATRTVNSKALSADITLTAADVGAATSSHTHDYAATSHTHTLDQTTDTATRVAMTPAERTKLGGVATGATANATNAQLRDRATHTGTQSVTSLSDFTEAVQDIVGAQVVAGSNVTATYNDTTGALTISSTGGGATDPEIVRDTMASALVAGANVTITPNDGADTITISATGGGGSPALKTVWATPTPAGIQAAIDSTTEGDPKIIMIPAGTYNMADLAADRLVIPQASRAVLRGESFGSTRLLGVPGQPVISFENKYAHSWLVEDLHLYYATQQTGTVPAIRAGGLIEDEEGTFHNHFRRLRIENAAVAFGLTRGAGKQTSWDLLFEQCSVESCYTHVLDFDPQIPIGVPIIRWRGGSVMNHGQMPSTGYVGGAAFNLVATELFVDGLDIEGWHGPLLVAQGGSPASLKALHVEHHRLHAGQQLAYMANGPLSISEVSISGQTVDGTPSCFVTEAGGHLDMASSTMVWTGSTSTGILTMASGGTGVVRKSVKWPYGGGFQRGTAPYDLDSTDALSGGGVQIADTETDTDTTWSSSKIAAYVAAQIAAIGGGGGATAPTVTTTALNALGQGAAFSQTLAATGTAPITWAVTAGTLPAGLSLSSAGVLSGTPTGSGAYSFTVTATNSAGSDTQQYTGTVTATGSLFVATEPRTVFIGDSITASDSTPTGDRGTSYPNIASILTMGRLRYWQNRGVGGEQTPAMVSRFAAQVTGATPKPGVVVIMGGTNDTANGGGNIPTIMGNLDTMVQAAKTAGIQPILCAPPPTRNAAQAAKLQTLRDAIAAYTQCHTVTATFDALKDTDGLLKPSFNDDNIHPSSLGLHELGVALAGALPTSQLPPPVQLSTVARPAGTLVASGINCLAAADGNSDGLADGVTWASGGAPGTTTASLVAGAPGGGNWQRANINVTGWSMLFRINFDLTSVPDGGRCVLAVRMRWNAAGQIGLNCYYPPLPNGSVKVIANDGKRHYPWTDGVAHIELTKVAGQNSASFQWNCFPGTGTLDITQFTGYTL